MDPGQWHQARKTLMLETLTDVLKYRHYPSCATHSSGSAMKAGHSRLNSLLVRPCSPTARLFDHEGITKQRLDQCMLGAQDEAHQPVRKTTAFLSNRRWRNDLKRCGGQCRANVVTANLITNLRHRRLLRHVHLQAPWRIQPALSSSWLVVGATLLCSWMLMQALSFCLSHVSI